MIPLQPTPPQRPRRWYVWPLIVVLFVGAGLGAWAWQRAGAEDRVGAQIQELGGMVEGPDKMTRKPIVKVSFAGTKVTDASLDLLKQLPQLQKLNLYGTPITDVGLEHLKGLANLEDLNLTSTQITDEGLVHLKALPKLRKLQLGFTQISDKGLEHLQELTRLDNLGCYHTHVTDAGLEYLRGLTNLQTLTLGTLPFPQKTKDQPDEEKDLPPQFQNRITDRGLEHLKGLTKLEKLFLKGTFATDTGVEELQRALPDVKITRTGPYDKAGPPDLP